MPGERSSLPDVAEAAFKSFQAHKMTDYAAALTYYAMMSLFPALLAMVSILGLGRDSRARHRRGEVRARQRRRRVGDGRDPGVARQRDLEVRRRGRASRSSSASLVSLNGASGAFGAAGRALNVVYGVDDDRGFVRGKSQNLLWTVVVIVLAIVALVSVFLGGQVAERPVRDDRPRLRRRPTCGATLRWLVALLAAMLIYAIVYAFAPDIKPRRFRWISPGAVLGVVLWLLASAAFFFYVSNFSSYGATYGAFASAVVLLLWLYLTNLCLLLGARAQRRAGALRERCRAGAPPPPTPPPSPIARRPLRRAAEGLTLRATARRSAS